MKGVAIDTIIKVMLLLLVLLSVTYVLIKTFKGAETLSLEQCRFLFIDWCKNCVLKGWTGNLPWSEDLLQCVDKYYAILGFETPIDYVGACGNPDAKNECAKFGII